MAKKYVFVRMPEDVYGLYKNIQNKMTSDVSRVMGRPVKLPMTKVFKAVASPELNENFIQVDLKKLSKLSKRLR